MRKLVMFQTVCDADALIPVFIGHITTTLLDDSIENLAKKEFANLYVHLAIAMYQAITEHHEPNDLHRCISSLDVSPILKAVISKKVLEIISFIHSDVNGEIDILNHKN